MCKNASDDMWKPCKRRSLFIAAVMVLSSTLTVYAQFPPDPLVDDLHDPVGEHADQGTLKNMVVDGHIFETFVLAFELGDELFEFEFNALDGGGANVGNGQRWTKMPRADLNTPGSWPFHIPARSTGPNSELR